MGEKSVGGEGDEGGRSVMKWQTGCQTPHSSETLTHRLMDWVDGRGGKEGWMAWRQDGRDD